MGILSLFPAVLCVGLAYFTAFVIGKYSSLKTEKNRFASIDGIRGYLAFFVFLHHTIVWYFFLRTSNWVPLKSVAYEQFGQGSVCLFFMITGLLFWSKVIRSRIKPIDWNQLYVSRFFRIAPLYLFAVCLIVTVVSVLSHFAIREPASKILSELFQWCAFTIYSTPDINKVQGTFMIIAGVIWTLRYEWLFYMSLPLLSFLFGYRPDYKYLVLSIISTVAIWLMMKPGFYLTASFGGGMLAAYLSMNEKAKYILQMQVFSLAAIACLVLGVMLHTFSQAAFVALFSSAFVIIASGNSLFGFLNTRPSYIFGQMGYSLYLLHGILLFATFRFAVGYDRASQFSAYRHWALTIILTPILMLLCHLSFLYIEKPAMAFGRQILKRKQRKNEAKPDAYRQAEQVMR